MSSVDIEDATPESFLMQAGYLTIKDIRKSGRIILDFPNYEVKQTLGRHLLRSNYSVKDGHYIKYISYLEGIQFKEVKCTPMEMNITSIYNEEQSTHKIM